MIKLVIMDLDDTMTSEMKYLEQGYKVVAEIMNNKYGIDANTTYNRLLELYHQRVKNNFNQVLEENHINYTDDDIAELITIYRTSPRVDLMYVDVAPFIHQLRKYQIQLGIITDGPVEAQKTKLKSIHAYDIFDYIVLTDEMGIEYRKPNPTAYQKIIEQAGVLPEETLYIGDNPAKDFYIKKHLNIKTVRIIREDSIYASEEYLEGVREDITVKDLGEISL